MYGKARQVPRRQLDFIFMSIPPKTVKNNQKFTAFKGGAPQKEMGLGPAAVLFQGMAPGSVFFRCGKDLEGFPRELLSRWAGKQLASIPQLGGQGDGQGDAAPVDREDHPVFPSLAQIGAAFPGGEQGDKGAIFCQGRVAAQLPTPPLVGE